MLKIKNILLARDLSSDAGDAFIPALRIAKRTDAILHVVFVEVLHGEAFDDAAEKNRALTKEALAANASSDSDPHRVQIEHAVVRDVAAAPALLNYAAEHDIDLIVMGTHGRRGVRRLLMGSVTEEVVRLSFCPVLTIRRGKGSEEEIPLDSILVPVDFSEHARAALRHAKALGNLLGARLDVLHVVEENLHPAFYGPTVHSIYDIDPDLDEKALAHLKDFYQRTEGPGTEVTFAVRSGHAVQEIMRFAEEEGNNLIVIGTHGLTGIERFFLGSVAEKVVRRAPCPVFTVKSFGKSLVSPRAISSTSSEAPEASQ